ncbi:uncharacterized protein LOC142337873 isoform X2 [Convolutriloba macropyga]|uniref:uncharacterized protein LOC142337873 isoform X2 n=1 Tax=Convolutriloba macropyga TaxID=536237 RepID=UPI003F51E782
MDSRPKTSRGIPAYGSGSGVGGFGGIKPAGVRLSTEELLKRASGHLKGGESGSRGGETVGSSADFYGGQIGRKDLSRVTSSYDANRKVRSSTETYLNNLSRKASKASQDKSDDDGNQRKPTSSAGKKKTKPSRKTERGVAADSDESEENLHSFGGDTTSSSTTLGKGGASFLKKKPNTANISASGAKKTVKSSVKTAKAVEGSGLISSSDDDQNKRPKGKQGSKRDQMNRRHVIEDSFSEDDDDRIKFTKTEGEDSPNEDDLDKSIDIDALINEQPSTETSSRIKKRLSISRQPNIEQEEDEAYDNFDAESPPKTPVSARKEVRFSTQLSIASGEENMSVVESVMDTESIQMGGTGEGIIHADHKSQSGHKSYGKDVAGGSMKGLLGDGAARVSSLFQDSDLEMEVNLGIEDILPATVKPDKSLPDSPSDPEDPFDNHIQDINDLVVASDSPSPTLKPISVKQKEKGSRRSSRSQKKHKRLSSFRTSSRSSTTSASEDDVMEEIVSASENEISIVAGGTNEIKTDGNSYTSHEEQLMSIGKLPDPSAKIGKSGLLGGKSGTGPMQSHKGMLLIESEGGSNVDRKVENKNIEESIATEVQSTEELKVVYNDAKEDYAGGEELGLDDSRRSSRASLYSQDSFDEVSTTEPPFSDTNIDESESDVTLMDKEEEGKGRDEEARDRRAGKVDDVSSVSRDTTDDYSDSQSDATASFPSYSPNLESKAERRLKKSSSIEGKYKNGKEKTKMHGIGAERSSIQMTAEEYYAERETATAIDRVFHQIVTIQPKSIASMVVEKDTIDAMTNYNPSSVALTAFMRSHIDATRTFIENTRRLHEQYQKILIPDYNYTNMNQVKAEIKLTLEAENNKSLELAIDRVEQQMGRSFSQNKRQKIREKVNFLKSQKKGTETYT